MFASVASRVIKLLHQIVTATTSVAELDFSWLEEENGDVESEKASPGGPPKGSWGASRK